MIYAFVLLAQLRAPEDFHFREIPDTHTEVRLSTDHFRFAVAQGMARSVTLRMQGGYCSGFILETNRVLTAGHCFDDSNPEMTVNGKTVKVIKSSRYPDLMLLEVETEKVPKLALADLEVAEEVILVGTYRQYPAVVSTGRVVFVGENYFLSSTLAVPGISGAPIYNIDGKLVGVSIKYQGADTPGGGVIVFGENIRAHFIKKFLEEK